MRRPTLSKGATKEIGHYVDRIFDQVKARMLGPDFVSNRNAVFYHKEPYSLPGLYRAAALNESVKPNEAVLMTLAKVAESYLNAQQEVTKARVLHAVNVYLATPSEKPIEEVLGQELTDVWTKVTEEVTKIANSEAITARNMGTLEGIVKTNAIMGVEDPIVAFIGPLDENTCKECRRVLYINGGPVPKVFKLSEVSHAYHERGTDTPSISGMHPNCRHSIITMMPGYGFDEAGRIKFKGLAHRELDHQRPSPGAS
jgi:hypothetical protein